MRIRLLDLHFDGRRGDAGVIHAVRYLVPDGVRSGVGAGGDGRRVNAILARAVLHRADVIYCGASSSSNEALRSSGDVSQVSAPRCACQLGVHPVNRPCDAVGPVDDVPA